MEALHGAPLTLIQQLCEIGGKPLIMAADNDGHTALHDACSREDANIDTVKYLVQNGGGMELINKKDNDGKTAADIAKERGNDSCYNFLKDALQFPFHALCSCSIDVTASKIQEYLNQNDPSCVFQTNHVSKTPLHNLYLNRHAPSDAIEKLINAMLQTEPTGEFDLLKSTMNMAQDSTIAEVIKKISQNPKSNRFNDKKIHGGLNDDPKQTPDRLDYDKYAEGIVKVVKKAEMSGNYFCVGLYGPWGSGKTTLWNLIKKRLEKRGDAQDGGSKEKKIDATDWRCVLFGIVEWCCCLRTGNAAELPHNSEGYAIHDAQEKERNEVVALLFILLLPIWIILGIVVFLLQRYGKCECIPILSSE